MPNKPIEFKFNSDVEKLLRGLDKAEISMGDLEDAVKRLPKASEKAADDAAKDFDRIGDSAGDAGRETADEFKQNLGSGLASGGSPAEIITESLGGLVSSLKGPLGLAAAGVAGVAALAFTKIQENAEKAKSSIEDLAGVVEGLYTQGVVTATKTEQLETASKWIQDHYDLIKGFKDEADLAGIELEQFAAAASLGGQPLEDLRTKLQTVAETAKTPAERLAASDLIGYLDSVNTKLDGTGTKMDFTAGSAKYLGDYIGLADRNMDGVIDDADQLYVNLDKAKQKADTLGDEASLAELEAASAAVEEDTRRIQANMGNLADPGMPKTKADVDEIDRKLRNLPKNIETRVTYTAQTGGTVGGSYTSGYTVGKYP